MATQRGYGNYGQAGYGRGRSQRQLITGDYKSAFNPIPIEFLQEQLRGRQGQYDAAFAGSIQAKEQMAAQQAALQDLGAKNELISNTMGGIDKVVEEKYGGDWGRASKEIASMVSTARQNPFWESTKHLSEQQKLQQDFQLKNPNAWIYNDVNKQSTIDPATGQVRDRDALTFRGSQRSNYGQSIEQQYADVRANVVDAALKKAEGAEGMLSKERTEQIKDETLKALAAQGVDTFLNNNPDYLEGHMSLGMNEEQVRAKAEADIYGQISDKAYSSVTSQVMQDKGYWEAREAAKAGAGGTQGIIRRQSAQYVDMVGTDLKQDQNMRKTIDEQLTNLEGKNDETSVAQRQELEAQRAQMDSNFDFVFDSMQNSASAVNINDHFTDYTEGIEKLMKKNPDYRPLSEEEFNSRVMEHLRNGTRETSPGANALNIGSFNEESIRINQAVNKLAKNFKKHAKRGEAVIKANVITGTEGAAKEDTFAGQYNNLITEDWKRTTAGYTVPYSNRQIGDILDNEREYKDRDATKDEMVMTDGTIDGKFVYQLNLYDKEGAPIGSKYVIPDDQTDSYAHLVESGQEIYQQGLAQQNPYYMELGKSIIRNANYGPSVQKAKIHQNINGEFKGINYGNKVIKYENVGTFENPRYQYYVDGPNGKDWFETQPEKNKPAVRYEAVDEEGIKRHLEAFVDSAQ